MMKRDALDNALRQKLHDHPQNPPKDLWVSIEADLAALPAKPERGRVMSLKRNALRYGIAASVLIAALLTGILKSREPIVVADLVEQIAEQPAQTPQLRQVAVAELFAPTKTIDQTKTIQPSKPSKTARLSATIKQEAPQTKSEVPQTEAMKAEALKAEINEMRNTPDDGKKSLTKSDQHEGASVSASKPHVPEWYNEMESRAKRRRKRKSTSLYAANLGFGSSNINTTSMTARAMSDFRVNEVILSTSGVSTPISREYEPESLRHHAPLSFGLSFSWGIGKRFDIETGLTYTYLKSDATIDADLFSYKQKQELHYMGIPVAIKYNAIDHKHWALYARAGAMIEKGIYGKFSTKYTQSEGTTDGDDNNTINIDGVQGSVSIGVGGEYRFNRLLGIYIEPSMNYYFKDASQPCNYRTENPLHFALKAGFRVNF